MRCAKCGEECAANAKFCSACGAPMLAVEGNEPQSAVVRTRHRLRSAATTIATGISRTASATGSAIAAVTSEFGDFNGDGKLDREDLKIAAQKSKIVAGKLADELGALGTEALKSDAAKSAATGAVIGAAIAAPLPIVGSMTGAAVGAIIGVGGHALKSGANSVIKSGASTLTDVASGIIKAAKDHKKDTER